MNTVATDPRSSAVKVSKFFFGGKQAKSELAPSTSPRRAPTSKRPQKATSTESKDKDTSPSQKLAPSFAMSLKVSFKGKLTKLRKQPPPHSFTYTTQADSDDDLNRFGVKRQSTILEFHGLPPLHSLEPTLSTDEIESIVSLICNPTQTSQSPTFMKYSQAESLTLTPVQSAPILGKDRLDPTSANRDSVQERPTSLVLEVKTPLTETLSNRTDTEPVCKPASPPKQPPARYRDIHKLNSRSTPARGELYRRYSDGFRSNKRRVSCTGPSPSPSPSPPPTVHPWRTSMHSRPNSMCSSRTGSSSLQSTIEELETSDIKIPRPLPAPPQRHPELLRQNWKNVNYNDDPDHIYALANEIANHRIKERRTILQLRLQKERNKTRWAFDGIPRVHIQLPQARPQPEDVTCYGYNYPSSPQQPGNIGTEARIARINSRARYPVLSFITTPQLSQSSEELSIHVQTSLAKYKLMCSACATYLNKAVQGHGAVLPKGQLMARLTLLRRTPKKVDPSPPLPPVPSISRQWTLEGLPRFAATPSHRSGHSNGRYPIHQQSSILPPTSDSMKQHQRLYMDPDLNITKVVARAHRTRSFRRMSSYSDLHSIVQYHPLREMRATQTSPITASA